tara:strand:- start:4052 stop:4768 length:717 start_codon:yes stop_codon:yes gene_type:complete
MRGFILNTLKKSLFVLFTVVCFSAIYGQNNNDDKALFSGVVFSSEALTDPLSQVNVLVNNSRGTNSDDKGFFSIYLDANDTLVFSHVGYHSTTIFIPDSIKGGKLIARIFLVSDTVNIEQVVVTSRQDYTDFKKSFMKMENDKELTNAKNNINMSVHEAKTTTDWTVEDNLERGLQKEANKSVYYGQLPPENTVNFITVAAGLFDLMKKDKKTTKNKRYYRELINLQNQNNIVYLKGE